ncbi:GNAT family N-acetyltransferase [Daejeonella lutea]|uniref:Acetyltransferase (GNAT) domain-containing protein n=1 Tax=Daejeonella lutea TaxID=572036 RepID=A0A1T5CY72_9SPHI|nr:GNAT family N-acetyltransferase [Daejeonella lutea]SKB64307.1 Acetyltransferase (GNAT) domain-containing protein [Daejeonella lutea]
MPETPNLTLLPCDVEILTTALKGNHELASRLNITVPEAWTEFGPLALEYSRERLADADQAGWWTYFPIHQASNTLIGSGGYKGKPNEEGVVEIGYEIAADYRNQGLATEFCRALVEHAFKDGRVKKVIAHTLGEDNASTKVLSKSGFLKTEVIEDPEDGIIWKWERGDR